MKHSLVPVFWTVQVNHNTQKEQRREMQWKENLWRKKVCWSNKFKFKVTMDNYCNTS